MKRKSTALLLIVALLLSLGLTACSTAADSSADTSETTETDTSETTETDASETTDDLNGYPEKDITVIVPYGAGGTTDTCVRSVINAIPEGMVSKNVVVSNVSGGSGLVGATQLVNSDADGYTLGVLNCDLVLNRALGNTEITSDQFIPLACIENDPYLFLVSADAPYDTFEEFVNYVLANPGTIAVGDTGPGAVPHLVYTVLNEQLGLDMKTIAYDSSNDSVIATVSGECDATISAPGVAAGQLEAGTLKPLASSGAERLIAFPDVSCMSELYSELENMNILSWIMLVTLKDTPSSAVPYLQDAFTTAASSDAYKEILESFSFQAVSTMTNEEMLDFVAAQAEYYDSVLN